MRSGRRVSGHRAQVECLSLSPALCGCGGREFDQRLADILLRTEDIPIADKARALDDDCTLLLDGVGERTLPSLLVDLDDESLHRRIVGLEIALVHHRSQLPDRITAPQRLVTAEE